ncbi:MAG: S-layer homology domain-containing protein, partial [Oscillospiraceae bacterium]|nr:S-layer homology domain-containing protein [Oscillospiraceae bacterium]
MKHTKQLVASLIVIALLCSACSAGMGGDTTLNAPVSANSSMAVSQARPLSAVGSAWPFSDVPDNAAYAPAVAYCLEHHILAGTSTTTFEPETITTRAMAATILYRMEGEPSVTGEDSFTDTASGVWYSNAVLWASNRELLRGYGGGVFGVNDSITREQLITVLHRYLGEPSGQGSFSDIAQVSTYAQPAIRWAAETGICQDFAADTFQPAAPIHRWEMACVLYRTLTMGQNAASSTITTNGGETIALTDLAHQSAGADSTVYYISDISPEALTAIYGALAWTPGGSIAVKLSTGEP